MAKVNLKRLNELLEKAKQGSKQATSRKGKKSKPKSIPLANTKRKPKTESF
jgi:hypothetical protein